MPLRPVAITAVFSAASTASNPEFPNRHFPFAPSHFSNVISESASQSSTFTRAGWTSPIACMRETLCPRSASPVNP